MASITAISMAAGPTPGVGKIQSDEREGGNREGKSDELFHCRLSNKQGPRNVTMSEGRSLAASRCRPQKIAVAVVINCELDHAV
jgi:hypothetical protein